ncbi:hypothetical protein AKJ49_01350 [candidate division MSBL1 archaeon SCGC-AAA382A03]|uniref:Transposase IS66 central domain-containing protein n=1 Tax=candidate division MSBL1 archaeon SCGC-AAA382A03 TaxID=1698278 RepID=A0A133VFH3_9EURY|nr:hypothetical protein AKJ49_01350 [candidate division MSBL1 archaeon SCGC-AAA382A03]
MKKTNLKPRNNLIPDLSDSKLSFETEFAGSSDESLDQSAGLSGLEEEEYISIIFLQQEFIRGQQERIEKLENELRKHDNPHTPSAKKRKRKTDRNREKETDDDGEEKPGTGTDDVDERFPGKPEGSNGGGVSIPELDQVEQHTLEGGNIEEIGTREKTVIELVENPFEVVKHVIHVYQDSEGQEVEPEVDLPEGIYGKRFQAFVTLLRGTCGASHEKIAELVQEIRPDLSFSPTTSLNITDRVSKQLVGERERILEQVNQNKYVHMDETGLRKDGVNGWVWVFAVPQYVVYEVDQSRSKDVPEGTMSAFSGIAVVDGYPAYNGFPRQRCWDHLGREVEETEIERTIARFHRLYKRAKEAKEKPPPEREKFIQEAQNSKFPALIAILRENEKEDTATKLENALSDMFRGMKDPDIPLSNNHAERLMRKVVVHRKLWGCIRNEKGARFIENTLSCIETWKLQGKNIFQELQKFTT